MRKTAFLVAFGVACWSAATISACGSTGSSPTGSAGTGGHGAATGTTTGSATGGMTSTGSGEGGFIFDSGIGDVVIQPDGDACGSVALQSMVTPGNIVVVFDQSDSMNQQFKDADGGTSTLKKWQAAEQALVQAVMPIQNLLHLGAIFFPTGADSACTSAPITMAPPQIPIEPAPMFLTDFQGHFSAPGWTLILGTPLKQGLDQANTALMTPPPGQSAVVILTDGAPNCGFSSLAQVEPPIVAMAMRGIKTYVIGLPGSAGASTLLNGLAMAGGTTMYYSPSDPTDLQMQLATIASNTVDQCTIVLSPPPADPTKVHLIVTDPQDPNGVEIPESEDGGGDGWILSADGMTATLLGTTCTNAKNGAYTSITFVYGCPMLPQ